MKFEGCSEEFAAARDAMRQLARNALKTVTAAKAASASRRGELDMWCVRAQPARLELFSRRGFHHLDAIHID